MALALPPILLELDTDVAGVAAVLGVYAVVLAVALLRRRLGRGTRGAREGSPAWRCSAPARSCAGSRRRSRCC